MLCLWGLLTWKSQEETRITEKKRKQGGVGKAMWHKKVIWVQAEGNWRK